MKNLIYKGEVHKKQYIGVNCLKRWGAWRVCRIKGKPSQKRWDGIFDWGGGVDTPMQTMIFWHFQGISGHIKQNLIKYRTCRTMINAHWES